MPTKKRKKSADEDFSVDLIPSLIDLAKERNMDPDEMRRILGDAIVTAYVSRDNKDYKKALRCEIGEDGKPRLYERLTVVPDSYFDEVAAQAYAEAMQLDEIGADDYETLITVSSCRAAGVSAKPGETVHIPIDMTGFSKVLSDKFGCEFPEDLNTPEFFDVAKSLAEREGLSTGEVYGSIRETLEDEAAKTASRKTIHCEFSPENGTVNMYELLSVVADSHFDADMPAERRSKTKYNLKIPYDPANISVDYARAEYHDYGMEHFGREIEVGDVIVHELPLDNLGRIKANQVRHLLRQSLQDIVRNDVIKDINTKRMELITATVLETSPRGTTFTYKTGREQIDLFLKPEESIPGEVLYPGDRRKLLIIGADRTDRGIRITITRAAEQFVAKLFEQAVPEIKNGKIIVKGIVREPGVRTKLAVESTEPGIDPVGSCIGPNKARVEAVRQELGDEKIDIIPFSQDSAEYIAKALAPAKVVSVEPDPENAKKYNVRVKEDQFSLAIGGHGVNVGLAARLTGYKINIIQAV